MRPKKAALAQQLQLLQAGQKELILHDARS
jgi:hypothetical protein